jgi:hypothetical protein
MFSFRQENDCGVNRSRAYALEQFVAPARKEAKGNLRKLAPHLFYGFCEGEFSQRVRDANLNLIHRQMAVYSRSAHFPKIVEQASAPFQHNSTWAGQTHRSCTPVE